MNLKLKLSKWKVAALAASSTLLGATTVFAADSVQGMRRAVARTQEKKLALDFVQKPRTQSQGMRI